jgi:hypothetical protein
MTAFSSIWRGDRVPDRSIGAENERKACFECWPTTEDGGFTSVKMCILSRRGGDSGRCWDNARKFFVSWKFFQKSFWETFENVLKIFFGKMIL